MSILDQTQETDVRALIREHLKKKGITKKHIAVDVLELSEGHFSQILQGNRELTQENLNKINADLGTTFKFQTEDMRIAG